MTLGEPVHALDKGAFICYERDCVERGVVASIRRDNQPHKSTTMRFRGDGRGVARGDDARCGERSNA